MRNELTKKTLMNMAMDPRIQIVKHGESNRTWIWFGYDYTSGELVEVLALQTSALNKFSCVPPPLPRRPALQELS
jgi:hypothetical protein